MAVGFGLRPGRGGDEGIDLSLVIGKRVLDPERADAGRVQSRDQGGDELDVLADLVELPQEDEVV